jgi:hypothetical protein
MRYQLLAPALPLPLLAMMKPLCTTLTTLSTRELAECLPRSMNVRFRKSSKASGLRDARH